MLTAVFYAFSKRENSTLIPSSSVPSYSMQIDINDPNTSVLNPQLRVRMPSSGTSLLSYNYVYIQDLLRYYYIDDWTYNADGTWTASCSVDVLSSWKSYIMNSPGYIGRAEMYYSPTVPDKSYPVKIEPVTIRDNALTGFTGLPGTGGTVLLTVTTTQTPPNGTLSLGMLGGVRTYAFTMTEFLSFVKNLLGWSTDIDPTQIIARPWELRYYIQSQNTYESDWFKSLYTPAEYIVSCRYYPFQFPSALGTTNVPVILGGWQCGGLGATLIEQLYCEAPFDRTSQQFVWGEISISNVSQVGAYSDDDYPTYAPYAEYALQTPWGTYTLDPSYMSVIMRRQSPKLYWKIMLNLIEGTGDLVVSDTNSVEYVDMSARNTKHEFFRQEVKVATDIPLQSQYQDTLQILGKAIKAGTSVVETIGAFATGNPMGAMNGLANTAFGVADTMSSTQRVADGSTQFKGNATPIVTRITVQQTRYPTVQRAPSLFGIPLKRYVSNLFHAPSGMTDNGAFSGFVQFDYSSFSAPCTETERIKIRNYLEGGVHIE